MRVNQSLSGRSVLTVGVVVVAVLALAFLVVQQVNFLVGRSLLVAFGDGTESTYRRAWFDWRGNVTAQDVVLHLGDAPEDKIRFATVRVETPGWFWFLRNTFDRKLQVARLERLHLTLEGLDSQAGIDPTLGDLGPIGPMSASPFEAEGCAQDGTWTRAELGEMGLMADPTVLDFDYRVEGSELQTKIALATPGVSRVQFERRETLPKAVNALLIDTMPTLTRSERWEVSDQGFVKARNAYCAKKDGVDAATFVARHVDAVQRQLQTVGLAVDPAALEAYRDFAAQGGQLAFGGTYVRPLQGEELYAARDDGSALPRMSGVLEHGSRRVPVQWTRFDPRPLDPAAISTWAALEKERASATAVPLPPGSSPVAVAPPAAARPLEPGAVTTTPDGRPLASSLPAQAVASDLAPPGSQLDWTELPRYAGHVLQVWTMHNEPRTAMLMSANGAEAQVRAAVNGGHAEYRIKREAFLRATLVQ